MPDVPIPVDYPAAYLSCPICKAKATEDCRALSGAIAAGRPNGTITPLTRPHIARKRSARA
jgi:hypothetical protein